MDEPPDDPVAVPLGFWLRTVDGLFDSSMDQLFASDGVTRLTWQCLNSIKRNQPADPGVIAEALAVSLDAGTTSESVLATLVDRQWAETSDGSWRLTDAGESALEGLALKVAEHRGVMFRDVSPADYRTTVETLAQIAENLDPDGTRATSFR